MKKRFDESGLACCKLVTQHYSTSFSIGIKLLHPVLRSDIYAIYGFVRCADEIVDSFGDYNQQELLEDFNLEYQKALAHRISLNPILNAFQEVVLRYKLQDLVESFLQSMEMDLNKKAYNTLEEYKQYIYGSADVVGLMCLHVFVRGDKILYEELKPYAMRLGSAFQKVNFLRDIKDDFTLLNRSYFPNIESIELNETNKAEIIKDIEEDFYVAWQGIKKLPGSARLGVYVAYKYYMKLLKKLKHKSADQIVKNRIRVSDSTKFIILCESYFRYKTNLI